MLEILPIILFPYARWSCLLFFSSSSIILNYAHQKIRKHLIFYCIVPIVSIYLHSKNGSISYLGYAPCKSRGMYFIPLDLQGAYPRYEMHTSVFAVYCIVSYALPLALVSSSISEMSTSLPLAIPTPLSNSSFCCRYQRLALWTYT